MARKKQPIPMKNIGRQADDQYRVTAPGQAHFAGTGPSGMNCRQCRHWGSRMKDLPGPQVQRAQCGKYIELTKDAKGPPVPARALACQHFEPNGAAAAATRWNLV